MPGRRKDIVMAGAAMASIVSAVSMAPAAMSPAAVIPSIPSIASPMSWRTEPSGPRISRRGEPKVEARRVARIQTGNVWKYCVDWRWRY